MIEAIGTLRHAGVIEDAIVARLQGWLPAYLVRAEADAGYRRGAIQPPRSIRPLGSAERWPEQQLPAIIVDNMGTSGDPGRETDGAYNATYSVAVTAIVSAAGQERARTLGYIYGAAIRGALLQRRSLSGSVETVGWSGEAPGDIDGLDEAARSLSSVVQLFEVRLAGIVDPAAAPPPSWTGTGTVEPEPPASPTDKIIGGYTAERITLDITPEEELD